MVVTGKTSGKESAGAAVRKQAKTSEKKGPHGSKAERAASRRRKASLRGALVRRFSRFWLAVLAFSAGVTVITLVWALNLSPPAPPAAVVQPSQPVATAEQAETLRPVTASRQFPAAKPSPPATPPTAGQVRAKILPWSPTPPSPERVYEVYDSDLLEQKVKEVDLVLVQTIISLELDPRQVRHLDIQIKNREGQKYHTQSLAIGLDRDGQRFIEALKENLRQWVEGARLQAVRKDGPRQEWRISLLDLPTHTLFLEFNSRKPTLPPPGPLLKDGPRLVVIIDDLGECLQQARELLSLSYPVTFAVLPHSSRTREVARMAAEGGRDVLLHQPMEPRDYPHRADPGPGALFVDMSGEEIRAILAENLSQLPQALGVNNHMGSRFTADSAGMGEVLEEVKKRGLFFLDSMTTVDSVVQKQADRIGLAILRRHIFLDNVQDVQAILFQLRKAESLALSSGEVIAIGHPYPETLEALKIWDAERDRRVQVVSVSVILPRPALAGR